MDLEFGQLKKADYKKAIQFAIEGMHFNWYLDNKLLQNLYGRYFLYLEMSRATQAIAAYKGDELAGVLLCEMKGEAKKDHSIWKSAYVKIFDFLQNLFVKNGVAPYDEANRGMLVEYCKHYSPDGASIYLAAGKRIYLIPMIRWAYPRCTKSNTVFLGHLRRLTA